MYVLINKADKYLKQKLTQLKGEICESTIIAGNINMRLSVIDSATRQKKKIRSDIYGLNITINHLDLIDIYRMLHPRNAKYTLSSTHGTFI